MKPHPRIRKTVKWGGAVVTVLLVVVWVASGWWYGQCTASPWVVSFDCGRLCLIHDVYLAAWAFNGWSCVPVAEDEPWMWWFSYKPPGSRWIVWIPLWIPTVLFAVPTAIAWRLDTLATRRARVGFCPKCNYDLTGLARASGAVCPECGAAAPPPAAR